jgi:DNA polymerase III epsilon subunit-like protein
MTDGFVFLDTETTGMEDDARVIDIALVQTSSSGEI